MSTRCNIIVDSGEHQQILYHHHDGYLSGVGLELYKALIEHRGSKELEVKPSRLEYFIEKLPRSYKDTDSIHGDIEYLYKLCYGQHGIKIVYKKVEPFGDNEVDLLSGRNHVNSYSLRTAIVADKTRVQLLDSFNDQQKKEYTEEYDKELEFLNGINPNI